MEPFVDVHTAHALMTDPSGPPPVVLDVRWALGAPDGRAAYERAHLPGAVYVDLDTELAAPPSPERGRHPLPEIADLQAAARRWGVRAGAPVIVYDDAGGTSAARAWWLLRWAGVTDVAILDGALAAWKQAGYPLESGDVVAPPGDVTLTAGGLPTIEVDEAAVWPESGRVLLDARAGERFRGEVEPVDPRPGHIPGATSAPTAANLTPEGALRPAAELAGRFAAFGVVGNDETNYDDEPAVAVYCGSGVTAAHTVAVLANLGVRAALFPGSWSQWSNDPQRPAAVGE